MFNWIRRLIQTKRVERQVKSLFAEFEALLYRAITTGNDDEAKLALSKAEQIYNLYPLRSTEKMLDQVRGTVNMFECVRKYERIGITAVDYYHKGDYEQAYHLTQEAQTIIDDWNKSAKGTYSLSGYK